MGTIVERKRKDGSRSYTAQIVVKQKGLVHREAQTFDRKQAAYAWLEIREKQLKAPAGLVRRDDPTLSHCVDRYIGEWQGTMGSTKISCLRKVKDSDLARLKCSAVTSRVRQDTRRQTTDARQLPLASLSALRHCGNRLETRQLTGAN